MSRAKTWSNVAKPAHRRGFTLIELMVVMAVLAVLATLVAPRFGGRVDQAREVVLKQDLVGLRQAIDQFYRDKARYPKALEELVEQRYIRAIPPDPITQRTDSWLLVAPPSGAVSQGGVFDIKSGAAGRALDGSDYASW